MTRSRLQSLSLVMFRPWSITPSLIYCALFQIAAKILRGARCRHMGWASGLPVRDVDFFFFLPDVSPQLRSTAGCCIAGDQSDRSC